MVILSTKGNAEVICMYQLLLVLFQPEFPVIFSVFSVIHNFMPAVSDSPPKILTYAAWYQKLILLKHIGF